MALTRTALKTLSALAFPGSPSLLFLVPRPVSVVGAVSVSSSSFSSQPQSTEDGFSAPSSDVSGRAGAAVVWGLGVSVFGSPAKHTLNWRGAFL